MRPLFDKPAILALCAGLLVLLLGLPFWISWFDAATGSLFFAGFCFLALRWDNPFARIGRGGR